MELLVRACWLLLALLHTPPSAALFAPRLIERLYGVTSDASASLLLRHRAAWFASIALACLWAAAATAARRPIACFVAASMLSFLVLYVAAGRPTGPLAKIARADLIGLVPLAIVIVDAARRVR